MVEAMDFRSDRGSACRFDTRHGRFYFLFDFFFLFMMMMIERASMCRNKRSECRR